MIYLIGSLRNTQVPTIAAKLRAAGHEVFDDWYAAGPEADDYWRDYERGRGHSLSEALQGYAAQHVFQFDKYHLTRADSVLLIMPAGKSGFLELGWALGRGKTGYILLDSDPERYDVMMAFADLVTDSLEQIIEHEHRINRVDWELIPNSRLVPAGGQTQGFLPFDSLWGDSLGDIRP